MQKYEGQFDHQDIAAAVFDDVNSWIDDCSYGSGSAPK